MPLKEGPLRLAIAIGTLWQMLDASQGSNHRGKHRRSAAGDLTVDEAQGPKRRGFWVRENLKYMRFRHVSSSSRGFGEVKVRAAQKHSGHGGCPYVPKASYTDN